MKSEHQHINKNGRIYKQEDIQKHIKNFTTLEHPDNLKNNVTHQISNIEQFEDGLYVDINTLNTLNGNILQQGLKHNEPLGYSARYINGKLISINPVICDKIDYRKKKIDKILSIIKKKN